MMRYMGPATWILLLSAMAAMAEVTPHTHPTGPPEDVYRGELVAYPGPWAFEIGRPSLILTSDEQLEALADPDRAINTSLGHAPREQSLRQICTAARTAGQRTLILAFDHFFAQYRPGQEGKPRRLTPDVDEYVSRVAAISRFAAEHGLGLELSLLSPLEIGPAYVRQTGESGVWMHYREGVRDPKSGSYSVQLWRQRRWANNKGPLEVKDAGVRVFAFSEARIHGTPYSVVDPKKIVEITPTAEVEVWPDARRRTGDYEAVRVRVHGAGGGAEGLDRVLVVQMYATPEMDYFSEKALPYLKSLLDKYVDAGVALNGLYADEMHIQQDWHYHSHHDHGEFALRYVSPGFTRRYAALYGAEYGDFAKYLVYFVRGQHDAENDLSAKSGAMHVLGPSPEAIRTTALLRSRYYRLLQDGVVELFTTAKRHAESRLGHRLESRAHATWAESPTCDRWDTGQESSLRHQYEYTPSFVWSNTVQQAASACHDYFKWGDFLTGNGNDHTEGGWLDRDYFGLALACSTGIINEVPYSYAAHWGMPQAVSRRRFALVNAYGAGAQPFYTVVQDKQHRDVDVLMLYPLDLVAVDERFGSWMTQYGYANYITAAKLLEMGEVKGGAVELTGRRFTTVVVLFEPFPARELLEMMRALAEGGGKVIWSAPPPVLLADGSSALPAWQELTGVDYRPGQNEGVAVPGRQISFAGPFQELPPMNVLTDFLVDHIYPVTPREGSTAIAQCGGRVVGATRSLGSAGSVTFLGFRPRDDQSGSLGYETRYWFEILTRLGAYPPSGRFPGFNDHTEYLSRTTPYLTCRFPNGTVAIAPHLRDLQESWPGGFARDAEKDRAIEKELDLPSERLSLEEFRVNGHTVSYEGDGAVAFRVDDQGRLVAFSGANCDRMTVNGRTTVFADRPMPLVCWGPVEASRRVEGGALLQLRAHGPGELRIPVVELPHEVQVVAEGGRPGSRGGPISSRREGHMLIVTVDAAGVHRWLYAIPGLAK